MLLVLAACAGGPTVPTTYVTRWTYRPDRTFVQEGTGDVRQPGELFRQGQELEQAGRTDDAVDAWRSLYQSGVDIELKMQALLAEARALRAAKRRIPAHETYLRFLDRYVTSPLVADALGEAFDNAFALAEEGDPHRVVGISIYNPPDAGLQAVRDLLNRFPREERSGECAFRLGEFHFRRGDLDLAGVEFESVRREYARTRWAEAALLRVGLCHLFRFKGAPYDPTPLAEARQRFEKFLQDYPNSSRAGEVRQRLAEVKGLQAEKDCKVADYYLARRRPVAARAMYAIVVKDFPGTPAAEEAARQLEALPPPPPREPAGAAAP